MSGLIIATLLWDANDESFSFSRCYDERWVERLYRGFKRNLTRPFGFVCFTDIPREFTEPEIQQHRIEADPPGYAACIEPYRLGLPMILVGLDTIVTGNCDHLADYCLRSDKLAVPRDPFFPETVCNGVALVPADRQEIFHRHRRLGGQANDMDWIRGMYEAGEVDVIDDIWPGHVVSYKGAAKHHGLDDARIVYFHGEQKPHELVSHVPWIEEHWR
jgi:hypothetical protein